MSTAECRAARGRVDRDRCERVFAPGVPPAAPRASLSGLGRRKGWAHGHRQTFVAKAAACRARGPYVAARLERAIRLTPIRS